MYAPTSDRDVEREPMEQQQPPEQQQPETDVCDAEPPLFSSSLEERAEVSFELSGENAGLQEELVPDWISQLRAENSARTDDPQHDLWRWVNPQTVEYIFTICLRLRLSYTTKYQALAIFNRFMSTHISTLYAEVHMRHKDEEAARISWEKIESNISRQIPLRVLSCVQVAAKLNLAKETIPPRTVRKYLQSLGVAYTENAIFRSELRVLESIGWCANSQQTPVICLESCLALLVRRMAGTEWTRIESEELWEFSNCLLDNLYLKLDEVYEQVVADLYEQMAVGPDRERLINRTKSDYLLMSSGIIATVSVAMGGVKFGGFATQELTEITGFSTDDISTVASVFLRIVADYEVLPPQEEV